MRFNVLDFAAGSPSHGIHRPQLVEQVICQFVARNLNETAAEPGQVVVPDMSPMVMPAFAASRQVWAMVRGSPAWNPQATLAEETDWKIAVSSPMLQLPYDSPTSEFRSMYCTVIPVSTCLRP